MATYYNEPKEKYYYKYCDKYCGVKGFSYHLSKLHNMQFSDYVKENLELFPTYKLCPICNENITSGTCCSRKCISKWKETAYIGRNIWEEMSEETRLEAKRKLSEKATINNQGRNIWAEMDDETKENAKQKISKKTAMRCVGEGNPMYGRKHSSETIQKILTMRPKNKLEEKVAVFLEENGIDYYFQFFINNDSTHSYDFKIKGKNLIFEIDGDYWHGGPGCKLHFFDVEKTKINDRLKTEIAQNRGYKLIRFWGSEIENNFDLVKKKILEEIGNYQ